MDEATCFSYVAPKIFASSLIVHINDNKFLIAIMIIVHCKNWGVVFTPTWSDHHSYMLLLHRSDSHKW